MTRYRFFTYKNPQTKSYAKWELMSERAIAEKVTEFGSKTDCYATVQHYDEAGRDKRCPLFLDFDGKGAKEDAADIANKILTRYGTWPHLFFSGGKGCHVVLPIEIKGEDCERIAKEMARRLNPGLSWDQGIYSTRRMWRINNTFNTKGNAFKRLINEGAYKKDELIFEQVMLDVELAREQVRSHRNANEDKAVYNTSDHLPDEAALNTLPPCLEHVLINRPPDGLKHYFVFALSVFLKNKGMEKDKIKQLIFSHGNYSNKEMHGINQSVDSVFKADYKLGCGRASRLRTVMKKFCQKEVCIYESD